MTIYHKHHIIPKHMGGSDDPSNIVKLTIEEHAEAHRILYEQFGNEYDRIAWLGLTNSIDSQELVYLTQVEGGRHVQRMNPDLPSIGGKALWSKPGMREHLIQQRKEQSKNGKNPMQGKKQNRASCTLCKREFPVNALTQHYKKCKPSFSVPRETRKPV